MLIIADVRNTDTTISCKNCSKISLKRECRINSFTLQNAPQSQWIKRKEERGESPVSCKTKMSISMKGTQNVNYQACGLKALSLEAGHGGKEFG